MSKQELGAQLAGAKAKFTLLPRYEDLLPLLTYKESHQLFGFPRHPSGVKVKVLIDKTTLGDPIDAEFRGELRQHQEPVFKDLQREVLAHRDVILKAETAFGKTVVLLALVCAMKVKTLVIVPKTDLITGKSGWLEKILEFTDISRDRVGLARQDVCDHEDKDIVLGMIHSVCKDKYPEDFKNSFGLVIFDELHKLGAPYFSKVGPMFPARYRVGATATLRRADGFERAFYDHLGDFVVTPVQKVQPKPKIIVYKYRLTSGGVPDVIVDRISRRGMILKRLANNKQRTEEITGHIDTIIKSGRQTLVLADRIPPLEQARELLIEKYPKNEIGLYLGRTSDRERVRVAKECRCILATTNMLSLGTDIDTLRALVPLSPAADVEQSVGRIRRTNPGEKEPVYLDVFDTAYPETRKWFSARMAFYRRNNFHIEYLN